MTYQPAQPAPAYENVGRGTVVALLAIPAGVIVWVIIWSIGFIASIVSFGVALLAMFLYRLGSGGQIGRTGAIRVAIITITTIALSIFTGLVVDVAVGISQVAQVSPIDALSSPAFWTVFNEYLGTAGAPLYGSIALAVVFGIFGCFSVLRRAFRATGPTANATGQVWPQNPTTPQQLWPQNPQPPQQQAWPQNPQPPQQQPFPPGEEYRPR